MVRVLTCRGGALDAGMFVVCALACRPRDVGRLSSSDMMCDEREALAMFALRPEADIWAGHQPVCFGPKKDDIERTDYWRTFDKKVLI